jgi:hypothetical protein
MPSRVMGNHTSKTRWKRHVTQSKERPEKSGLSLFWMNFNWEKLEKVSTGKDYACATSANI